MDSLWSEYMDHNDNPRAIPPEMPKETGLIFGYLATFLLFALLSCCALSLWRLLYLCWSVLILVRGVYMCSH